MPSSSSAMAISPVGVVNACNPAAAARQAYDVASLIHVHDVGFCQDGAAAIAAAVSEAFRPGATVDTILQAAVTHLHPASGQEMRELIADALALAARHPGFDEFARAVYEEASLFRPIMCDSRETVPLTLAIFWIAGGDFERTVTFGANFGRDADTIATMGGAIAGALNGLVGIRGAWVDKLRRISPNDYDALSRSLADTTRAKASRELAVAQELRVLTGA